MAKKTRIRIGIVVVITCVMGFSDWSFAADDDADTLGLIAEVLNFAVSLLSRLWVIFAKLTGEFLTNKWVYGEALGIDSLLWQYRNIVKNMANFCLGFYLLYVIFKGLIGQFGGKEDVAKNLKNVLLWVLIAGIGVQASRFLTSVVIDVSTITISAVGAFPAQAFSQNEKLTDSLNLTMREYFDEEYFDEKNNEQNMVFGKIYELFPQDGSANSFTRTTRLGLGTGLTRTIFLDSLLPNQYDVAGPLYYLGFQILRVNDINSINSSTTNGIKESILNLIVQGGATIVYAIEIGVLCIIALMRVLYLWMFVVLSPFAILLTCIQKANVEKDLVEKGFVADLMKQIKLKVFLGKAFQPAIIVFGIGLSVIFVTLISGVINGERKKNIEQFDIGGILITSHNETVNAGRSEDQAYSTKIESPLLNFSMSNLGKGFLDFMLSIISVILVYFIIKMSITVSNKIGGGQDFLSKKIESIQKGVEGVMTSIPIVPVAGYDKEGVPTTRYMSAGKIFGVGAGNRSLLEEKISRVQGTINDKYNEQNQIINSWIKSDTGYLSSVERRNIENMMGESSGSIGWQRLENTLTEIKTKIRDDKGKGMTLNGASNSSVFWIQEFEKWLEYMNGKPVALTGGDGPIWTQMINWWNDPANKDKRNLENMFSEVAGSAGAYARFFFENDDDRSSIQDWTKLQHEDISQNKQSGE